MTGGTTYTLRPSPNPSLYYFGLGGPLTGFKLRFISIHQYYVITKFRVDRSLTISHLNPAYSTLHYPVLFPCGEDGWHSNIPAQKAP